MPPLPDYRTILLILCGIFSTVLGLTHVIYPQLFRYRSLIFTESNLNRKLEPFRLWPIVYPLNLHNLYAIIWMMNFHVSFVMITLGFTEVYFSHWLLDEVPVVLIWFAGWWFLRAACQTMLGREWYDWLILVGFAVIAIIHLWLGLA